MAIEKFGTRRRRQVAAELATGEMRGGLALTEPDCRHRPASDPHGARRDGDDYVVNGTKTWISNGIEG